MRASDNRTGASTFGGSGRLAEHHFGCTVHVLDDGFQHFALYRDADVLLIAREDVEDPRTLPTGRLREPLDAGSVADARMAERLRKCVVSTSSFLRTALPALSDNFTGTKNPPMVGFYYWGRGDCGRLFTSPLLSC